MRSNAGMATRRRDVDLREAQVSALRTLASLGIQVYLVAAVSKPGVSFSALLVSRLQFKPVDGRRRNAGRRCAAENCRVQFRLETARCWSGSG